MEMAVIIPKEFAYQKAIALTAQNQRLQKFCNPTWPEEEASQT